MKRKQELVPTMYIMMECKHTTKCMQDLKYIGGVGYWWLEEKIEKVHEEV